MRKVLVLVNPKSGLPRSFSSMRAVLDECWEREDIDLHYQFTQSKEDGIRKARRAVETGVDTVLVAGGDGTVSTIGRVLLDTPVALGVIPLGSGNGFARHFGIPMQIGDAVRALASSDRQTIDVGMVNDTPFLVTCSMAWDAALVQAFEKWPMRGVLPYVFAGVQEFFDYQPQDMDVRFDDGEEMNYLSPVVFTIANLTQFGGGARIAPSARADDGMLELVVVLKKNIARVLPHIARLFDGSLEQVDHYTVRRFSEMTVQRQQPQPIQVDGELLEVDEPIRVGVRPAALQVLVPR